LPSDHPAAHESGRGTIFDGIAEQYDELRPSYPPALVHHVLGQAALPDDGAILEIGCGTGKATRLFAASGRRMVCVEPGVRMAALAAGRLEEHPKVSIENARFEDWPIRQGAFDLAIAAQSFHWVDPEQGYSRLARCLRPGGSAALFWNRPGETDPSIRSALDAAYLQHAPELVRNKVPREMPWVIEGFDRTELFESVDVKRFPWTDRRSADAYAQLVATYSDHAALPDSQREALLGGIRDAIVRCGGEIVTEQYTLLYFTKRRR
jgi:SAM-dependent methyltransferase